MPRRDEGSGAGMAVRPYRVRTAVAAASLMAVSLGVPAAYAGYTEGERRGADGAVAAPVGERYAETRLFFGTERPDGGPAVTDAQFREFVDREVTPRFPEGLTVREGRGQWRDVASGEIVRERSYELVLLYPVAEAERYGRLVERVRKAYRVAYAQDSVARVDDRVRVSF
ncbi:DUF3574 domain-containing protein [Streptomyces alkaliterrae]|nr:DUF3574 domain-containing protein [Streptomyces alkaliterrae]